MTLRQVGSGILIAMASSLTQCTTVSSVSISQVPEPAARRSLVTASASSPVIFLIPFNTDYLDEARENFVSNCQKGAIEGVLSKHETVNYFLSFIMIQRIHLQGYCVDKVADARTHTKRKG